uniref:Reverse transcriptase domain-containing protein n=1 Tax=Tanacetum cinerariifolium TaxID=118510 RepID=A0A6L2JCF8_TANCI|nr:reverse transcriptase domain-containing protein [Tanacetum cinerariifolium]
MYANSSLRPIRDQSSNPTSSTNTNPKGHNHRGSKQRVKNFNLEEHSPPVVTMVDQRTMTELLHAPTEGYAEAILVPPILAEQFELKHSLINMMTTDQFFRLEKDNPHDHIRWINKITSTIKYKDVPNSAWDRYKHLLRACPRHGFTELHQLDTFYNALNPADQDSLNAAAGGNLLERSAHPYYQCLTAGGNTFLELRDNIQGYVSTATVNYNQGSGSLPSNIVANPKGKLKAITTRSGLVFNGPTIHTPPQSINLEVDDRVEETFTDPDLIEYTIKVPPPPKMVKALLSNKEILQELANTPLNENCSGVILKRLPKKLGDPGKFLILCGFSELKCKALADLGASINLMPLSVWKKLGLPELIPTRITLELANRVICTPAGIARDVFVPVGKFTFPTNFVIVDYENDPRVPLILGRPFLQTAHSLIYVHGKEMILHDGDERMTLNMRHDTSSYSNQPQKESINLINVFNNLKGCNVLSEKLLDLDSTKDLHPPLHDNLLSGSTTYFSNPLLEEFADELPPEYDDNLQFDIEFDLKEIEFLLYQDKDSSLKDSINQKGLANLADIFVDSTPEMFTDKHALDYSSPLIFDEYDDDFLEVESDARYVYDDPFDSKGEKIKESKLLIHKLDLPYDFLPPSEYDSFISQDFSSVDSLPSTNNEDKIFNQCILIQEKPVKIITRVVQDKKLAISNASLVLEDFDLPFYEPLFFKEVPKSKMLLLFSSKNEEKVFKPGYTLLKKFILILSQNYLIKAIKFSKSTRFSKA